MPTAGDGRRTTTGHASNSFGQRTPLPLYHRLESSTQTPEIAREQERSGEIWGRAARWSNIPSVKAYRHALPDAWRGIEFTTPVAPTPGRGSPYEARWYDGTPGVAMKTHKSEDFAVIKASVDNRQDP